MASLIHQHGHFYLQFYASDRTPKRKRVPLHVTVKRDAAPVRRRLEADYAVGRFDPCADDPRMLLRYVTQTHYIAGPRFSTLGSPPL